MTHSLKCWPVFWDAVNSGEKTFDVRRNDRGFQKGDTLLLRKYEIGRGYVRSRENDSLVSSYSDLPENAETISVRVLYVLSGSQFGIVDGFVVMGIAKP